MKLSARPLLPALASVVLLAACGGGVGVGIGDFEDDPFSFFRGPVSSTQPGSMTVTEATNIAFNGTYAASNVRLTDVIGFQATASDPATCRYRFHGLQLAGRERVMDGEIRYLPDTSTLRTAILAIDTNEYRVDGSTGVTVDRAGNTVTFNGVRLASTQGFGQAITVSGTVPILDAARPAGC